MGLRQRSDGQALEGTVGAHRQCDLLHPDVLRHLPLGLSCHHVRPPVRGVLPVLCGVVGRGSRQPAHAGRTRTVVASGRIPPHARDRFRREPVRLLGPQGSLHRVRPVRGGRRRSCVVGQEVRDRDGNSPAPQPDWYNSSSATGWGFAGGSGGPSFDSFDSALSSSIGAYTASQSSSSSGGGSGGGGFSGGGGGGGGGGGSGSW